MLWLRNKKISFSIHTLNVSPGHLNCLLKVKEGLSVDISTCYFNAKYIAWIDAVLVVKDIIVIFRKNETIFILISLKRYFCTLKINT